MLKYISLYFHEIESEKITLCLIRLKRKKTAKKDFATMHNAFYQKNGELAGKHFHFQNFAFIFVKISATSLRKAKSTCMHILYIYTHKAKYKT